MSVKMAICTCAWLAAAAIIVAFANDSPRAKVIPARSDTSPNTISHRQHHRPPLDAYRG